jgi:hypothetical protein
MLSHPYVNIPILCESTLHRLAGTGRLRTRPPLSTRTRSVWVTRSPPLNLEERQLNAKFFHDAEPGRQE